MRSRSDRALAILTAQRAILAGKPTLCVPLGEAAEEELERLLYETLPQEELEEFENE